MHVCLAFPREFYYLPNLLGLVHPCPWLSSMCLFGLEFVAHILLPLLPILPGSPGRSAIPLRPIPTTSDGYPDLVSSLFLVLYLSLPVQASSSSLATATCNCNGNCNCDRDCDCDLRPATRDPLRHEPAPACLLFALLFPSPCQFGPSFCTYPINSVQPKPVLDSVSSSRHLEPATTSCHTATATVTVATAFALTLPQQGRHPQSSFISTT